MRIISYNLNGIRSAITKGLLSWIAEDQADVYCFQELKANTEDIDTASFEALGYHCYWYSAQKKGYSGVGIITKEIPVQVNYGCGIERADYEGRVLQLNFKNGLTIVNTYFPSGSSGDEKQIFKMYFLREYLPYLKSTFIDKKSKLILAGDYNICHKPIDIHDPVGNKNSSGFLPEERAWMDEFFEAGMVDGFRKINQEPHQYSWWSFRFNARANNKGWRIDYINLTKNLEKKIKHAAILPDVKHSDHCPVLLELDL
jgi:exodeoxyribonuclease-3